MYSRQIEQLARQRTTELRELTSGITHARNMTSDDTATAQNAASRRGRGRHIRNQTGWALVSLGLRLAESASH